MKTIITLNGYSNYGNRLQLFALSKVLKMMGGDVVVFWPKSFKKRIKGFLRVFSLSRITLKKERKLKEFTKRYTPKAVGKISDGYCIVGSDQVWNPKYFEGNLYLLKASNHTLNISYAASIGADCLTKEQAEMFRGALKNYKAISVREKSAKKILQPLTDKKIKMVLDPTLLLDSDEYERLEKKPKDIELDEKYIFCYVLGGHEYMEEVRKYAREHNYRMILFSDKDGSGYGIEEFLYLIRHAKLICTDSFHACVFSFIFERPFLAFKRTGDANYMYSRIENLINIFHLNKCEYSGKNIKDDDLVVDYVVGKRILRKEREKSLDFLRGALGIKNEN